MHCNLYLTIQDGKRAIDIAKEKGHMKVVQFLQSGAQVHVDHHTINISINRHALYYYFNFSNCDMHFPTEFPL